MAKKRLHTSCLITCLLTVTLLMCFDTYVRACPIANDSKVLEDHPTIQVRKRATFALRSLLKIDWSVYHGYLEIEEILISLNKTFPEIVDIFPIGKSWGNKTIYCARLTNENKVFRKPKIFFVGYHHAREPISAELPLYFLVYATENYGSNATITRMLDLCEIYVVAALNVDGFDIIESNDWQRKNAHPIDEDQDGLIDEDSPDDEDEDGYIEYLWNASSNRIIRWEGIDDDSDGRLNEDWIGGVDLNRNYYYAWNTPADSGSTDPYAEDYRGPEPFSEPETKAMKDLALEHDFKYAISFHSGAEVILYPWGHTHNKTSDDYVFTEVAADLAETIGVPYEQSSEMYTTSGVWDDWMYGNRNIIALTCEIFNNSSAWLVEPGPELHTFWIGGILQVFNPVPNNIQSVLSKWLPVFTYIINKAIGSHIPGDLNGDGVVNILDISIVAQAFGTKPGDLKWNTIADVDNNGVVNIIDIALVAKCFGRTRD